MTPTFAIAAVAALAVPATATGPLPRVWVDLGLFRNNGPGQFYYDGAFPQYITTAPDPLDGTVLKIDLGGILASFNARAFTKIIVSDSGVNNYGTLSPGADIDFLWLKNITPDNDPRLVYLGPNPVHQAESAQTLAQRIEAIDSSPGSQDAWNLTHVSLGDRGVLGAILSEPELTDSPHVAGRPKVFLRESGALESFHVGVQAVLPSPGTLALLGIAGLVVRRRRRAFLSAP